MQASKRHVRVLLHHRPAILCVCVFVWPQLANVNMQMSLLIAIVNI